MEALLMFVGTSILGWIGYLIMGAMVKAPGSVLQTKFANLTKDSNGMIAGKTYEEVVAVCGLPSSNSPIGDGNRLCQWMATGYHIALLFDENNVCLGISHEAKV